LGTSSFRSASDFPIISVVIEELPGANKIGNAHDDNRIEAQPGRACRYPLVVAMLPWPSIA
jgi:hypothetical protein